jgi:Putative Flp pilus-assembly TadE/G-like
VPIVSRPTSNALPLPVSPQFRHIFWATTWRKSVFAGAALSDVCKEYTLVHAASPRPKTLTLVNLARRFRREEDGGLIMLGLFLFVLMVMIGGVAIDLMRYEKIRTTLQNTLDRCTLMAASLTQNLDPESVVTDCVTKAGLARQLKDVEVVQSGNNRQVKSTGLADTNPLFLHMVGIDDLDAIGGATAQQGVGNVELSLVLDVSGSMAGTKIANLKSAANEFVDTVLAGDTYHKVSISLVPFNGQVNLGPELRSQFNVIDNPNIAGMDCIDLPASVYSSSAMSTTLAMPMTANADTFSYVDNYLGGYAPGYSDPASGMGVPIAGNRWCTPQPGNAIRPLNSSVATLQGQINGLTAVGATSINAGVKWGLTLLDPNSRGVVDSLRGLGVAPSTAAGRPYNYGDNTQKIIVVMTDGEHFPEERVNNGFRSGLSPIYRANDGRYSILIPERTGLAKYWVPHIGTWAAAPYSSGGLSAVQQTWPQVWAAEQVSWVAYQLYARARASMGGTLTNEFVTAVNTIRTRTPATTMNNQLQSVCNQAKDRNVIVYGIAFEAPAGGQAQILQCSTDVEHFFNATNAAGMRSAFRAIASNITQLKLTQ